MKFHIERNLLLAGMQQVSGVVERRNTMPILSHVFISATTSLSEGKQEGTLAFFATDLETGVRCRYPAHVSIPGKMTAPARKFFEIVRELPEGIVKVEQDDKHWISIESGNAIFKIAGLPPDEYPSLSLMEEEGDVKIPIDPEMLSRLIRKTVFAAGENDPRYILNGLLLNIRKVSDTRNAIRMVGTDGHRLAMAEDTIKRPPEGPLEESVIIPRKAVVEMKRLLEETSSEKSEGGGPLLTLGKGVLTFRQGTTLLASRLVHGNYPNYQQVIPRENEKKVSANKEAIRGALGRVSLLSDEKTAIIKVRVEKGEIIFQSSQTELGEARETVPTSYEGESFSTLFSARYLSDLLAVIDDDDIVFAFKDGASACLVQETSGRFLSVLMPLQDD